MTATIRDTDGRPLGVKALATRLRLLEALDKELADKRYRDLTVLRVAFRAGLSAAAAYQYFPDLETAVHALAALDQPRAEHLTRVLQLLHAEDQALGVTRAPEPDTRLQLLAALTANGGQWTTHDAQLAFLGVGIEVTSESCDTLLQKLAARGELREISPRRWAPATAPAAA